MDRLARAFPSLSRIDLACEADFTLGSLRIRPSRREVEADGVPHLLQRRVMQVLVALAHPTTEVVSHDELIRRCWGGLSVGEDAVGRCIGQLRRLAAQWTDPPFRIETIAGVGYRLDAPAGAVTATDDAPAPARRPAWRPSRLWVGLAGGVLTLALVILWAVLLSQQATPPARVAVLQLETLSSGQNARYLADSIPDEALAVLSANQVEALSRTDAVGLRGPSRDREVAKLGVGFLLDGSVQDDGASTRVSIRLDDARSRVTLWSADYRRDNGSAADLQTEVAAKVADIIEIAQFARADPHGPRDDAALSALLEAHDLIRWDRRQSWARLLELAQRVVSSAPRFAFGHTVLATANAYAVNWEVAPQQSQALAAAARREANQALALDPHDSGAYFALSFLTPSYQEKEAILLKGLATPGHPAAPFAALNNTEGDVLLSVGRLRDAPPFIQRGLALDPLSPVKTENLIRSFAALGQLTEAQDLLEQALKRWPNHPGVRALRLSFLSFSGATDDALALLADRAARPTELTPQAIAAWRAFLDARRTPRSNPSARAAQSISSAADAGALDPGTAILMLSSLGDVDPAFERADHLFADSKADPAFLFTRPAAALRADPRFMNLAARLGLVDYWRRTGKWPDFCAGPHPEIDCRAATARAGV